MDLKKRLEELKEEHKKALARRDELTALAFRLEGAMMIIEEQLKDADGKGQPN